MFMNGTTMGKMHPYQHKKKCDDDDDGGGEEGR